MISVWLPAFQPITCENILYDHVTVVNIYVCFKVRAISAGQPAFVKRRANSPRHPTDYKQFIGGELDVLMPASRRHPEDTYHKLFGKTASRQQLANSAKSERTQDTLFGTPPNVNVKPRSAVKVSRCRRLLVMVDLVMKNDMIFMYITLYTFAT